MKLSHFDQLKRVVIYPGQLYVSNREVRISTLLGSCVAACLFDPVNRILGMNHFLLSNEVYRSDKNGSVSLSGRYGVQAMELLINKMMTFGAERKCLKAKAFGGASLKGFGTQPPNGKSIGSANVSFIREFLANERIPLVAEDLGGTRGRTIYFVSVDHSVFVRKHDPVSLTDLIKKERQYKRSLILEQQSARDNISLWQ